MRALHLLLSLPLVATSAGAADLLATSWLLTQAGPEASAETSSTSRPQSSARPFRPVQRAGIDDFLIEAGALPNAPEADWISALRLSAYALWQPAREWEFRLGARLDGASQSGGATSFTDWEPDLTATYVRYRSGDMRLTLGAQDIVWGRVDEVSVIDRVSRVDLTRFILDALPERRRAQFALRWEQALGDFKADTVVLPWFRGAALPDVRSVWSPVNKVTGELLGVAPTPGVSALVRSADIREDDAGSGGLALRLSRTGVAPLDFGITIARTRQHLPYYQVDAVAPSLTAIYPYTNFFGVDAEIVSGGLTWRTELGTTDGVPVTTPDGRMITTRSLEWVGAVEFFPGGADTRVNLQLAARTLGTDQSILELKEYFNINGEVATSVGQGSWKLSARFSSGLNVHDVYVAPRLSYLGWEPHEIYIVGHYFNGESRTLGGFHRNHDMLAIGLKTKF